MGDKLNPKSQDLSKSAFSGEVGEGVMVQTNIPEILEWVHSMIFEHKFCHAILWKAGLASQIVSYMLRVWRLISER